MYTHAKVEEIPLQTMKSKSKERFGHCIQKTPNKFKRRGPSLTYANSKITKIIVNV